MDQHALLASLIRHEDAVSPQWSPPVIGGSTVSPILHAFGIRLPQWSPPVIGGSTTWQPVQRQGYEDTMRASGLGDHIRIESADFTEDGGYRATVRLLSSAGPPTAIFAVDDLTCVGARSAASEMNIDVPGRLSLAGYDNTYLARLRSIWLTGVDSAGFEAGRLAARTLLARVADPARPAGLHLLPPALQVRGSTGPPPG